MSINIPKDKVGCFCSKCKIGGGKTISRRTYALHAKNDIILPSSPQMNVTTQNEVLTDDITFINVWQSDSDYHTNTDNVSSEHIVSNVAESDVRRRCLRGALTNFCEDDNNGDQNNLLGNSLYGIVDDIQLDICEEETGLDSANQNTIGTSCWRPSYRPVMLSPAPSILSQDLAIRWVLLWVFMFQQAFMIPKAAISCLLNFLGFLFFKLNNVEYERFPDTTYKAYKMFSYDDEICKYYVCPQCHLLNNPKTYPLNANGHTQCRKVDCVAFLTKAIRTSKSRIKYKVIFNVCNITFHKTFTNNIV